jgi:hypothetical protein
VPSAEPSGDDSHFLTVLDQVEGMQDQAQGGEIGPDVVHLADLDRTVKYPPGENVGDLLWQHGRSMQALAGVQPACRCALAAS